MKLFCSCSIFNFYLVLIYVYFVQIESKNWLNTVSHFQSRMQGPGLGFPHAWSVCLHIPSESKISLLLSPSYSLVIFNPRYCSGSDPHFIPLQWWPLYPSFLVSLPLLIYLNLYSQIADQRILLKIRKVTPLPRNLTVVQSL